MKHRITIVFVAALCAVCWSQLALAACLSSGNIWTGGTITEAHDCCVKVGTKITCTMKSGDAITGDLVLKPPSGVTMDFIIYANATIYVSDAPGTQSSEGDYTTENELIVMSNVVVLMGKGAKFRVTGVGDGRFGQIKFSGNSRVKSGASVNDTIDSIDIQSAETGLRWSSTSKLTVTGATISSSVRYGIRVYDTKAAVLIKDSSISGYYGAIRGYEAGNITIDKVTVNGNSSTTQAIGNFSSKITVRNSTIKSVSRALFARQRGSATVKPDTDVFDSTFECSTVCVWHELGATSLNTVHISAATNSSTANAGIYLRSGSVNLHKVTIKGFGDETTSSPIMKGSGVQLDGGHLSVTESTITSCAYGIYAYPTSTSDADASVNVLHNSSVSGDKIGIFAANGGSQDYSVNIVRVFESHVSATLYEAINVSNSQLQVIYSSTWSSSNWSINVKSPASGSKIVNNLIRGLGGLRYVAGQDDDVILHNTIACSGYNLQGFLLDFSNGEPYVIGNLVSNCKGGFHGLPIQWLSFGGSGRFQYNYAANSYPAFHAGSYDYTSGGYYNKSGPVELGGPAGPYDLQPSSELRDEVDSLKMPSVYQLNMPDNDYEQRQRLGKYDIGAFETPGLRYLSPPRGTAGSTLTVRFNGANFEEADIGTAYAKFYTNAPGAEDGIKVTNIKWVNTTRLDVTIEIDEGVSGVRDLDFEYGGFTIDTTLRFLIDPKPTITSISPQQIHQGERQNTLTIHGSFPIMDSNQYYRVKLKRQGDATEYSFLVLGWTTDGSTLTAEFDESSDLVPGVYDVEVSNDYGALALKTDALLITVKPVLSAVEPKQAPQGWGVGKSVKLTGTFHPGGSYKVDFIDENGEIQVSGSGMASNGSELSVTLDIGSLVPLGSYDIVVTNTIDSGTARLDDQFTITAQPLISDVAPSSVARGTTVQMTISGENFQNGATVTMDSTWFSIADVVVAPTSITFKLTSLANTPDGSYSVAVTNPDGGQATTDDGVVVGDKPVVTQLKPNRGVGGVNNVAIEVDGANFKGDSPTADFGPDITVHSVSKTSDSKLTVQLSIAPSAALGPRTVTVTDSATGLGIPATFTISPAPALTAVLPAVGGQNAVKRQLKLTGSGFDPIGGVDLSFSGTGITVSGVQVVSPTEILAFIDIAIDAGTGARDVTVSNKLSALGSATKPQGFTVSALPQITDVIISGENDYREIGRNARQLKLELFGTNFSTTDGKPDLTIIFLRLDDNTPVPDDGIEVTEIVAPGPGRLELTIDVAADAQLGTRYLRLVNNDGGRGHWLGSTMKVVEAPSISSIAPMKVGLGADGFRVTINGQNFPQLDDLVADCGDGTTATVVSVNSTGTLVELDITVSSTAQLGPRGVQLSHKRNGGRSDLAPFELVLGPTVTAVQPTELKQGVQNALVSVTGTDFDDEVEIRFSSGDVEVVTDSTVVSDGNSISFNLNIKPGIATGEVEFSVVNKTTGGTATGKLQITVNRKPVIDPAPQDQQLNIGSELVVNLVATDPDVTDAVTLSASDTLDANSKPVVGPQFTDNKDGTAVYRWTPTLAGEYSVTISVSDGSGGTSNYPLTITVVDPPAVITLPPASTCVEGFDSTYTFSACDPQGKPVSVTIEVSHSSGNQTLTPTLVEDTECEFEVKLPCLSGMTLKVVANNGVSDTEASWLVDVNFNTGPAKPEIKSPLADALLDTLEISFDNVTDKTTSPQNPTSYSCIACNTVACDDQVIKLESVAESGTGTTTCELPTDELHEDTDYYLFVIAHDGLEPEALTAESDAVKVLFSASNHAPVAPELVFPSDNGFVDTPLPSLSFKNAADPERQSVRYTIQVAKDAGFNEIVETLNDVPEAPAGVTAILLTKALTDHQRYFWRVRGTDSDDLAGPWSLTRSFLVNQANQLPAAPKQVSPADKSQADSDKPTLCWTNVSDPDGDSVSYIVEISTDASFDVSAAGYMRTADISAGSGGETCYTVEKPLAEDTTIHWRVSAFDGLGSGPPSPGWQLRINANNDAPDAPRLVSPAEGQKTPADTTFRMVVKASTDPDGDSLSYSIVILNSKDKNDVRVTIPKLSEGSTAGLVEHSLVDGLPVGTYYWFARVSDGTHSVDSAEVWSLTISDATPDSNANTGGGSSCSASTGPGGTHSAAVSLLLLLCLCLLTRRRFHG